MWIHIVIFGILLVVFIGSKAGWFSSKKEEKDRSLSLFLAVALAGNLLGMALTVQNGDSQVYVEGTGLKKEEDQTYEEKFMVSVDGKKAGSMYVQIPEKELEEEQEKTQDQNITSEQQQKRNWRKQLQTTIWKRMIQTIIICRKSGRGNIWNGKNQEVIWVIFLLFYFLLQGRCCFL